MVATTAMNASDNQPVRLDKWLWAARFFKTRSQAGDAIAGGHVKIGGDRAKGGHAVRVGQRFEIVKDAIRWEIEVLALSDKRGKGADAALLYRETEEGKARRLQQLEERRAFALAGPALKGRPTKRDRRAIVRFQSGDPK